jgi:hypothetical protein
MRRLGKAEFPLAEYATLQEAAKAARKLQNRFGGNLSPMLANADRWSP